MRILKTSVQQIGENLWIFKWSTILAGEQSPLANGMEGPFASEAQAREALNRLWNREAVVDVICWSKWAFDS